MPVAGRGVEQLAGAHGTPRGAGQMASKQDRPGTQETGRDKGRARQRQPHVLAHQPLRTAGPPGQKHLAGRRALDGASAGVAAATGPDCRRDVTIIDHT